MIATCNHEVEEGISCSIIHDKHTMSYGTYCIKCLKEYHEEDLLEKDSEVCKLLNELKFISEAFDSLLKINKELELTLQQQKFNNKHNLSIDQQVSDEIERLRTENTELKLMNRKYKNIIIEELELRE